MVVNLTENIEFQKDGTCPKMSRNRETSSLDNNTSLAGLKNSVCLSRTRWYKVNLFFPYCHVVDC